MSAPNGKTKRKKKKKEERGTSYRIEQSKLRDGIKRGRKSNPWTRPHDPNGPTW